MSLYHRSPRTKPPTWERQGSPFTQPVLSSPGVPSFCSLLAALTSSHLLQSLEQVRGGLQGVGGAREPREANRCSRSLKIPINGPHLFQLIMGDVSCEETMKSRGAISCSPRVCCGRV